MYTTYQLYVSFYKLFVANVLKFREGDMLRPSPHPFLFLIKYIRVDYLITARMSNIIDFD